MISDLNAIIGDIAGDSTERALWMMKQELF